MCFNFFEKFQPSPPTVSNPCPVVFPGREPWVSHPERYEGNLGQCMTFLMQCGLVFDLQPQSYSTDKARNVGERGDESLRLMFHPSWGAASLLRSTSLSHTTQSPFRELRSVTTGGGVWRGTHAVRPQLTLPARESTEDCQVLLPLLREPWVISTYWFRGWRDFARC